MKEWTLDSLPKLVAVVVCGFLIGFGLAQAENDEKVTVSLEEKSPYGTFTPIPSHIYGNREKTLQPVEAKRILTNYYATKGLRIGALSQRGDFFETDVYRGDRQVDRVIIHKVTGRIRSVY